MLYNQRNLLFFRHFPLAIEHVLESRLGVEPFFFSTITFFFSRVEGKGALYSKAMSM